MELEGTIVDGRVELDEAAELPNGTRVRVEPVNDYPVPPPPVGPYDPEAELNDLRKSIEDCRRGLGTPWLQFKAELEAEFGIRDDGRE